MEGRVQQVGQRHDQRQPRPAEAVAGEQPERERHRRRPRSGVHDDQEVRSGAQPVEGHEDHRDQVDVVAEVVQAPDRHEGRPAPGDQPDALVVDADVEAEGGEVGLLAVDEEAEHAGVGAPPWRISDQDRAEAQAAGPLRGSAGRLLDAMSMFTKILRAGEGKKVRALASSCPTSTPSSPRCEALSDDDLRAQDGRVPRAARQRRGPRRPAGRGLRRRPRGGQAGHRPAPLRRPADGRRRPALRLDRRDEDRRGQDPRLDPAGVPQRPRPARASTSSPSTTTWPAATPSGWAGSTGSSGLDASAWSSPDDRRLRSPSRPPTPATSPTAPTPSSASTTCATTWPARSEHMVQRGHAYAIVDEVDSILIDEARTPLIISGPSTDSAKLYYQFAGIVRTLDRDVDYEVDEEKRTVAPTEDGHREGRAASSASTTSTTWCRPTCVHQLTQAAQGQGALQAGQGLHRPATAR